MSEEGKVVNKALYIINQSVHKDILGFYIADSEGSNFWLEVNDLKVRGVKDILLACVDPYRLSRGYSSFFS